MRYLKILSLATILLHFNPTFSQEQPAQNEETAAPVVQEEAQKTDVQKWNAHIAALAENDAHWDEDNNLPTYSWRETAVSLAKTLLDKDKTMAENLKTEFVNAVTTKMEQKGSSVVSAYSFIKEFEKSIDTYVATLTEAESAQIVEQPVTQETKQEEPASEPIPVEPAPQEEKVSQPETTVTTETPEDIIQEWQNVLEKIKTEGTTLDEAQQLLHKAYELAYKLLSSKLIYPEKLRLDLEEAINERAWYPQLFVIDINDAMTAFSEATGIPFTTYEQQNEALQKQLKKYAEQEAAAEKQKTAELKTTATIQEAIKKSNISESKVQKITQQLEAKFAADQAKRNTQQIKLEAELTKLKQELAALRKPNVEKKPEAAGILSKAVGVVKNVATAASNWWYGIPQEETTATLDEARFKKLQELLNAMKLTSGQKLEIEKNWNIFINNLRTFKDLNTADIKATEQWLNTVTNALKVLTVTHPIISAEGAYDIAQDNINEYPHSASFLNKIKYFLETPAREKQKKEQQRKEHQEQRKKEMLEQQEKAKRVKVKEQQQILLAQSYDDAKLAWKNLLKQISQNKQATIKNNNAYTTQAIKKAESLINLISSITPQDKHFVGQKLKEEFTLALLKQQKGNETTINIHKNMEHFNNTVNKMME